MAQSVSSHTNPQWLAIVVFFKFLQRRVHGKHLMSYSETSVFKVLWFTVDEKHLMSFQSENAVFKFLRVVWPLLEVMKVIIVLWRFKIIDEITNDFLPISKVINLVWSEKTVQPVFTEPTYSFLIQVFWYRPPMLGSRPAKYRSLDRSLHQEHREYISCIVFCSSTVKLNRSTEKFVKRLYFGPHWYTFSWPINCIL